MIENFEQKEEYTQVLKSALRMLNRAHLSLELEKKLKKKGYSEDVVEKVLFECKRLGYIDDKEWGKAFVRSQQKRHVGPAIIAAKMRAKGMSSEEIEEFIESREEKDVHHIQHLIQTKYRNRDLNSYQEKGKVVASLVRKGFSLDLIREALQFADESCD